MPIRWIAFDAVGTLIYPDPSAGGAYHQVAQRHGSRLSLDEITARFKNAYRNVGWAMPTKTPLENGGGHSPPYVTSEEMERERWRNIVRTLIDDVPNPMTCFEDLYAHFADPTSWRLFDDVAPTLSHLRERGYQLAIASNFDHRLHAVCDSFPELRDITCRVISAAVGHRKPSRQFYDALLATTGCTPVEILMVGDDYENDVVGGTQAGLGAVYLDRLGRNDSGISTLQKLLNRDFAIDPSIVRRLP